MTRPNAIPYGYLFELTGYWQSYLHFAKHSSELRENIFAGAESALKMVSQFFIHLYQENFGVKPALSTRVHKILKKQLTEVYGVTWVGMHVRRTDFLEIKYASSEEYLFAAIDYFTERSNTFITPSLFSVGEDFIALSLCEHSIITGGTFGWWSAYLADGYVMYDKIYPSGCERREHYYPPWFFYK
ncbi:unnamed protein product [Rotaria magnacalcarata]|uniref:L-Fucosyltransferase n=1 Tax=Rotaria magnacalcarata TaxID=392030 RepID=A0A816M8Q4_9BILA|nr:unnamed protein product [Rotaria magnacalcarata]